ncbi:MAG: hypothetical protein ABIR91_04140 [Candidatus Saccharimonadales bacterium]
MRTVIVFKEESDHAREVISYLRDFARQTGHILETINPDTRDGSAFCRVHDIVEYPSVVALNDNGGMQNLWRGTPLPTISEVSFYV